MYVEFAFSYDTHVCLRDTCRYEEKYNEKKKLFNVSSCKRDFLRKSYSLLFVSNFRYRESEYRDSCILNYHHAFCKLRYCHCQACPHIQLARNVGAQPGLGKLILYS